MSQDHDYFPDPNNRPTFLQKPGIELTVLTGLGKDRMMMVLTRIDPGIKVAEHSHSQDQIGVCYGGKARMHIGGIEKIVEKGDFIYIPPGIPHDAEGLDDKPFFMVDIFCPIREDLLDKLKKV